jgi:hypothetical protein
MTYEKSDRCFAVLNKYPDSIWSGVDQFVPATHKVSRQSRVGVVTGLKNLTRSVEKFIARISGAFKRLQ